MSKKKKPKRTTWSVSRISDPRFPGLVVRVTELRAGGGTLYLARMVNGKQQITSLKKTRTDLGATAKEQEDAARALALDIIEELAKGEPPAQPERQPIGPEEVLTVSKLADWYEQRGCIGRGPGYGKEQPRKIRRIAQHVGPAVSVASLKRSDLEAYYTKRITVDGVRVSTARADLDALSIAINRAIDDGMIDS
ncbi:MAG: hypothetical protein ACREX4_20780, partial [Gammaproteobacteria bacterium]